MRDIDAIYIPDLFISVSLFRRLLEFFDIGTMSKNYNYITIMYNMIIIKTLLYNL